LALLSWGRYADYFKRPELGGLLWQFFCFAFAFATFMAGFALFAERRLTWGGQPFSAKHVGYVFAYAGFLGIILQGGLIGRLVRRFGEARVACAGFVSMAGSYGLMALVRSVPELLFNSTFGSFGQGALRPALTAQITQNSGRDEQGLVLGITQSLMSVAQITAPAIAGVLIDHDMFWGWGAVAGFAALMGLWLNVRQLQSPAPQVGT
jgi:MFS family permease